MYFCKVKRVNLEIKSLENLLNKHNISINDFLNDKDSKEYVQKTYGVDLSDINLNTSDIINIDLDKIIAIGEVESILGLNDLKAFPIWFDYDNSHCWYIYPEYYDVISKYLNKENTKPLYD